MPHAVAELLRVGEGLAVLGHNESQLIGGVASMIAKSCGGKGTDVESCCWRRQGRAARRFWLKYLSRYASD
jgi:hypothetical protein